MPKAWIRERKRDYYYQMAKKESYRSRAAYKLLQAVRKYDFIRSSDVVIDLGAAPGGWLQASRKIVGDKGLLLGVDLKTIQPLSFSNVHTLLGDITDPQTLGEIRKFLPHSADVVISDVSPNISGIWELDHARQIDLARHSLKIAVSILKPKGNFFVKVFQGDMLDEFFREVKAYFHFVKLLKPRASRARSAEIYILGKEMKQT